MVLSCEEINSVIFFLFGSSANLEKGLRQLMSCVDDVASEANKFLSYLRQYQKQQMNKTQHTQKRVNRLNIKCTQRYAMLEMLLWDVDTALENPLNLTSLQ